MTTSLHNYNNSLIVTENIVKWSYAKCCFKYDTGSYNPDFSKQFNSRYDGQQDSFNDQHILYKQIHLETTIEAISQGKGKEN